MTDLILDSELHDAGMACMDVLFEQVHAEVTMGNVKNIPGPLLRLFVLSVVPRAAKIRVNGSVVSPRLIETFSAVMRLLRADKDPHMKSTCDHVDAMIAAFDLDTTIH